MNWLALLATIASVFDPIDADEQVVLAAHVPEYAPAVCTELGYIVDTEAAIWITRDFAAVRPDLASSPDGAEGRLGRAIRQVLYQSPYDLFSPGAWLEDAKSDDDLEVAAKHFLEKPLAICAALASDPFTARYVKRKTSPAFESDQTAFADGLLAPMGRASWQSKKARYTLDFARAAGLCALALPQSESKASLSLAETWAVKDARPSESVALVRSAFENGTRAAPGDLSPAGCRRSIATRRAAMVAP